MKKNLRRSSYQLARDRFSLLPLAAAFMMRRISPNIVAEQNRTFELVNRNSRNEQSLASFLLVGIEWYLSTLGPPKPHAVTSQMRSYWEAVRQHRLRHASEEAKRVLRRRCGWRDGMPWPRTAAHEINDAGETAFAALRSEILGIYTRSAEVNTVLIAYGLDRDFAHLVNAFRTRTAVVAASEIIQRARRIRSSPGSQIGSHVDHDHEPRAKALQQAVADVAALAIRLREQGFITNHDSEEAVRAFSRAIGAPPRR